MNNGDEVALPAANNPPSLPVEESGKGLPHAAPALKTVLAWIGAAQGRPWFPSQHAGDTHTDRDSLDEPLNQLRITGLARIATWVRGVGQGYVLTPEGETALATGRGIPDELSDRLLVEAPPAIPDDPPVRPIFSIPIDPRPTVVVPILLLANLLWFFVGLVVVLRDKQPAWPYLSGKDTEVLHRIGAVSGPDLLHGEWWRLASSCFVHIGGAHIVLNLVALAMIGPLAELLWGRRRLLVIYAISGLAGSCLAMALKPNSLLAGASGAIWGVLTSLVAWFLLFRRYLPANAAADSTRRLTLVIVLNAMFSFMPGISWQGHLGGGLAGFATAWLLNEMRFGDRLRRGVALGLLIGLVVVCIGGLLAAMKWSEPWAVFRQRVASEERMQAARTAADAFDRDVAPLIEQLHRKQRLPPKYIMTTFRLVWFEIEVIGIQMDLGRIEIDPDEMKACYQLIRPGKQRNPARVAEVRAKLTELKAVADTAIGHLARPPTGIEALDQHLERAKAFAEARSRSLALLLTMLDSPAIPDVSAWTAWGDTRRTADALWDQLQKR